MYLKDKVFSKSAAYRFSKTIQFRQAACVCRFCKKTFCCAKCRDRHVNQVHPNVNTNCALCASETLPVRHFEFAKLNLEDEKLLCHIVDKHLPLRCRLCSDLFESREDFKSIAACKWYERWHYLKLLIGQEDEKKLKQCSISESDCNGSRFSTPPEIYRKTSTPMFIGQKAEFETPCVPEFNLKTPKSSITQIASFSKTNDTQFFSFLLHSSDEEMTPFKTSKNEQFPRSNSGRKLTIVEEQETTPDKEAEKMPELTSPVDMDLTQLEGGILQDSPQSDDIREDVVKKVRFSDQHKIAAEVGNLMDSCVRTILNLEEGEEEEEFHDAHDKSNAQKVKATVKGAKDTVDANSMKDTSTAKNTNDSQAEDKKRPLIQSSGNILSNTQIRIIQDNTKNAKKENENPEASNEGSSTGNQRDSNRVLMMVLMESNSEKLTTDLMPLISSGLKKLQEQFISANYQSPSSAQSTKVCRRSVTTMKMSVSSVESYSADGAAKMTNHGQLPSLSSPSSVVRSGENSGNSGFLSTVAQTIKYVFRSLSVSGFRIPSRSIETTQRQGIVKELTSPQESSSSANTSLTRPGKRTREIAEVFSKEDPIAFSSGIRSPLAKRHRGWYKMVTGRQPIKRMQSNRVVTSPRGVSAETQVFSQGSLTAGDTILPLPARAQQSTE